MKRTVVFQVPMDRQGHFFCFKKGKDAHKKAKKIAVGLSGVESAAITGQAKDQIDVKGDGIDAVKLATLLRKKAGHTSIVSVAEEKKNEPEVPTYDTSSCSII